MTGLFAATVASVGAGRGSGGLMPPALPRLSAMEAFCGCVAAPVGTAAAGARRRHGQLSLRLCRRQRRFHSHRCSRAGHHRRRRDHRRSCQQCVSCYRAIVRSRPLNQRNNNNRAGNSADCRRDQRSANHAHEAGRGGEIAPFRMKVSGRSHYHYLQGNTDVARTAMPSSKVQTRHCRAGSSLADSERDRFNGRIGLPLIAEPGNPRNLRFGTVLPIRISIAVTCCD